MSTRATENYPKSLSTKLCWMHSRERYIFRNNNIYRSQRCVLIRVRNLSLLYMQCIQSHWLYNKFLQRQIQSATKVTEKMSFTSSYSRISEFSVANINS